VGYSKPVTKSEQSKLEDNKNVGIPVISNTHNATESKDSFGGRILDNVATGMAIGTGSAIAHSVVNSISSSNSEHSSKINSVSTLNSNTNSCELLKEFYQNNKSKFDYDEDFNSKFMNLCTKFQCHM
jgi:hypothetical protein